MNTEQRLTNRINKLEYRIGVLERYLDMIEKLNYILLDESQKNALKLEVARDLRKQGDSSINIKDRLSLPFYLPEEST